jgi:mono/diheme cytochrome c family protein
MGGRWAIILSTLIVLVGLGKTVSAWSQDRQPPQRNFDYWQPDWMVRELWGPGSMPKGMMVRLLRHTTYMQYGVPKSYEGAKSAVPPGPQTIAAGSKLYGEHCAVCHGRDGTGDGEPGRAVSLAGTPGLHDQAPDLGR